MHLLVGVGAVTLYKDKMLVCVPRLQLLNLLVVVVVLLVVVEHFHVVQDLNSISMSSHLFVVKLAN